MRLIFIFSLFFIDLYSNQISGYVKDVESQKRLSCSIYIEELEKSYKSDSLGRFSFQLENGEYHLDFYKPNYKIKHIELNVSDSLTLLVELHPLEFHFDAIEVTANNIISDGINSKTEVLDGRQLIQAQKSTIAGTIKKSVGIGVRSMGPAPARPVYRGIGGPSLVITQDGLNSIDVSSSSQDHAVAIDPSFSQSIEIIKGARLLLFSPVSNSAVININEQNLPLSKLHKLEVTNKNTTESVSNRLSNYIGFKAPLLGFQTQASLSKSNSSDYYTPDGILENTDSDVLTYNLGLAKEIGNYKFGASIKEHSNSYGIPAGGLGQHPNGVNVELFRRDIKAVAKHNLDGYKNFSNAKLSFNRTYFLQSEYESSGLLGARFLKENYNFRYDLTTNDLLGFANGNIGINYIKDYYDVGGAVFTPEVESDELALFLFQKKYYSDFSFEFGLRYEFVNRTPSGDQSTGDINLESKVFNILSANLGITKELGSNLLGLNLFRSSRAPTNEELYSQGPHLAAYSYEIGNADLGIMENYGYDLNYQLNFKKSVVNISNYLFYYTNYITPRNTGEIDKIRTQLPIFQISSMEALFVGFEASTNYTINDKFELESDISYTYAQNLDINTPIPFIQPLKTHINLIYNTSRWRCFVSSEIAAAQNRIDEFETRTDGYYYIDIGATYFFNFWEVSSNVGLSAENLTNNRYLNHLSRIKDIMPEPGINIKAFLNLYY